MRNPNNSLLVNDNNSNNWLGDNVPDFNDTKRQKAESKRIKDFLREKYFSKEYSDLMDPFIQKLDPNKLCHFNEEMLSDDKNKCYWGYSEIIYNIANILELEGRPEVKFPNLSELKKKELGLEDTGAFYNEAIDTVFILDAEKESHYNRVASVVGVVAHEMWHKYQHDEIKKDGARASIYRKNFSNYIDNQGDLYAYVTQPVEAEAYVFGFKFSHAFRHILIKSLQDDIDEYNQSASQGKYDNPPDENYEYIYDVIAKMMEKKNDQLNHLKKIKDWEDKLVPCSQTK